jgi:folate-binding protein YgfZ
MHGVSEGIHDIPPMQSFPMDSNLDIMGAGQFLSASFFNWPNFTPVDFRKGCYVGQELTVRTYHTGVIRKRILPVTIHKPEQEFVSPPLIILLSC